jgi:hypothetical protein
MNNVTARMGISACAAFAMVVAAAVVPASAQTTLYPAGTDCTGLVGNSKVECANQSKNSASPDNSNNPSMGTDATNPINSSDNQYNSGSYPASTTGVDPNNRENYRNYPGAGADCAEMVGNTKGDCAHNAVNSASPDDSNNPDQMN